jgi:predicted ArsR family transcriptional regulator
MGADTDASSSAQEGLAASLAVASALADRSRRRMYEFIRQADRPISREQAAAHVGISRKLAAFHLDKLVEVGLLRAHFTPAAGTRRPGRAPKVYEPAEVDLRISIPERRLDLLAEILIDAVLRDDGTTPAAKAAADTARDLGARLGRSERERIRPGRLGAERGLTVVATLLDRCGFEPDRGAAGTVRLRNCPFQPLTRRAPELVCGINHAFATGVVDGLQATSVTAVFAPTPGQCCVQISTAGGPRNEG